MSKTQPEGWPKELMVWNNGDSWDCINEVREILLRYQYKIS